MPRDAVKYIKHWRDIAALRQHATEPLEKHQVQNVMHQYVDNFIEIHATAEQKKKKWHQNKSNAEAKLFKEVGSVKTAMLIWELGLPNIPEAEFAMEQILFATEQQRPLQQDVGDSIVKATKTILTWLSMLADRTQGHKSTYAYKERARKSGTKKNTSGLTEEEQKLKEDKKHAQRLKYGYPTSTASGSDRWHRHTWQAPAQWQSQGYTWQEPSQWQWHGYRW